MGTKIETIPFPESPRDNSEKDNFKPYLEERTIFAKGERYVLNGRALGQYAYEYGLGDNPGFGRSTDYLDQITSELESAGVRKLNSHQKEFVESDALVFKFRNGTNIIDGITINIKCARTVN